MGTPNLSVPVWSSTDEEFESYVEQVLASSNANLLHIILEKMREKTVSIWVERNSERLNADQVRSIKDTEFIPAIRRLVLFGLLLLKFSAPLQWFERVGDLLVEIFSVSKSLGLRIAGTGQNDQSNSLASHVSHTVPAVESLLAAFVLAGCELTQKNHIEYIRSLFPRVVEPIAGPGEQGEKKGFFLFWPLTTEWGFPNRRRDLLAIERYSRGDRIARILGGEEGIKAAVLQADCLVDWHSFMSFHQLDGLKAGEPETARFFADAFANVPTTFPPHFAYEPLRIMVPLIEKLWQSVRTRENGFWLLNKDLAGIFDTVEVERRQRMLVRFVRYAEGMHSQRMFAQSRIPYTTDWPREIAELLSSE